MTTIDERNPELEGIGRYQFGWSDSDAAGSIAKRGLSEEVVADRPDIEPAEALAVVFTDEGYAASVRDLPAASGQSVGEQLCQQHCPVSHVAHEFPQLCEAETEAIGRVLGRHVQRLATIAHGDGVCTTCIPTQTTQQSPTSEKEKVS